MALRTLLTKSFWLRSARESVYALASLPLGVLWCSVVVTHIPPNDDHHRRVLAVLAWLKAD